MARPVRAAVLAVGFFVLLAMFYLTVGSESPTSLPDDVAGLSQIPVADAAGAAAGSGSVSGSSGASASTTLLHDDAAQFALPAGVLNGGAIAPKLENATIKQELGRASWRLLHTMMARFPEEPTPDDSLALKTYVQLFARLYPCGQCAAHFQTLLAEYPPQTSSRTAAAGWACFAHNEVNKRLHKEIFDCSAIGDFYDCGCGDEKKGEGEGEGAAAAAAGDATPAGELAKIP